MCVIVGDQMQQGTQGAVLYKTCNERLLTDLCSVNVQVNAKVVAHSRLQLGFTHVFATLASPLYFHQGLCVHAGLLKLNF